MNGANFPGFAVVCAILAGTVGFPYGTHVIAAAQTSANPRALPGGFLLLPTHPTLFAFSAC